jgi:hypothetical protein
MVEPFYDNDEVCDAPRLTALAAQQRRFVRLDDFPARPLVVICGSLDRAGHAIWLAALAELQAQHFVYFPVRDTQLSDDEHARRHRAMIDIADEVLIVAPDDRLGVPTQAELAYAVSLGKSVRWWPPRDLAEMYPCRDETGGA